MNGQFTILEDKLKKDLEFASDWEFANRSSKVDLILIISAVLKDKNAKIATHKPLHNDLFYDSNQRAICDKYITYEHNRQAKEFGSMFKINVKPYVLENYRANSCYPNLIVDTFYDAINNSKKGDNKKRYKELTYDSLCEIIGIENKHQDLGLSIHNSLKFF